MRIKKTSYINLELHIDDLEDPKKFYSTILFPLIFMGIIVFLMPFIFNIILPISLNLNPITFIIGGVVPIFIGVLYPYISWRNKENDINGKMHFFITHLRVLAISDLSLKDIINILGGKKVYGELGKELKKINMKLMNFGFESGSDKVLKYLKGGMYIVLGKELKKLRNQDYIKNPICLIKSS